MPKVSYEFVKQEFAKVGYRLISTEYIKAIAKLDYECDKKHISQISYNGLQRGRRCGMCNKSRQLTFDEVKDFFISISYELLSPEEDYKNGQSVLKFKCDDEHINEMKLSSLKAGCKCNICTGNKKLTYEFVKCKFEEFGYTLITDRYTNARTPMDFICDQDHNHKISYDDLKSGVKCSKCVGGVRLTYDEIKKAFEDEGYTLLSKTYQNAHKKLDYMCDNDHTGKIAYTHFKDGERCTTCIESRGERAVRKYLDSNPDVTEFESEYRLADCKDKRPLPFDFFVNSCFLIEYDGSIHFTKCDYFGGDKGFAASQAHDKIKTNYCRDNGIPLLRIAYKDIDKIPALIKYFMNKIIETPNLIYFSDKELYKYLE
ncbi:MAG: hypothetical protein Harvfovirus11_8 [Harvfovirus sp.]|uniref:Uncharacterized protein n=1 Tax=Harvfovirus sp. TaxID=2487768 RepID=A0A3G5A141_9VIRU|nr:MAG: hypothetical protein Harvfovirus11_8 [Harvfovirus sp.]